MESRLVKVPVGGSAPEKYMDAHIFFSPEIAGKPKNRTAA
jgi:hypothetical protein